jgi:hypothetical protein
MRVNPTRAIAFLVLVATALLAPAAAPPNRPTVPVALYVGTGVGGKGPAMLEEKFHADTEFRITRVQPEDIRAGKLDGFKVLIVPGGSGSKIGNALGEEGREQVRRFVADGGTYVGICAGCYLSSCQYKWSLHILPAKVVDTPNWQRGRATLALSLTPEGMGWLGRTPSEVRTIYHNGPVLQPLTEADGKGRLVPLALYREEITRKGAKAGLMVDTPALAAARFGKGWAVGVSPHPEQTDGLKDIVPAAIRWTLTHPATKTPGVLHSPRPVE